MADEKKIRVIMLESGKLARTAEIGTALADLQKAVGDLICPSYPYEEMVCIVCNDESKINGMQPNRGVYVGENRGMVDFICGPAFICDYRGESFGSLSDKQIERYKKEFRYPEYLVKVNGELKGIKYRPAPLPLRKVQRYRVNGNLKKAKKVTGFRALYYHYCYLLGVFPKDRPKLSRQVHFFIREDLRKLNAISNEAKLLTRYKIDTAEQLTAYKSGVADRIDRLTAEQKGLYKQQRTASVKSAEVKECITALSKLYELRREQALCIAERSGIIKEKIKTVREDEQNNRKEKTDYEHLRRFSRTGR